jgi:hypothetical protein
VKVARWLGARAAVEPEQEPDGFDKLSHVGPVVRRPAGGVGWSVTFTLLSDVFPVFVTSKA